METRLAYVPVPRANEHRDDVGGRSGGYLRWVILVSDTMTTQPEDAGRAAVPSTPCGCSLPVHWTLVYVTLRWVGWRARVVFLSCGRQPRVRQGRGGYFT